MRCVGVVCLKWLFNLIILKKCFFVSYYVIIILIDLKGQFLHFSFNVHGHGFADIDVHALISSFLCENKVRLSVRSSRPRIILIAEGNHLWGPNVAAASLIPKKAGRGTERRGHGRSCFCIRPVFAHLLISFGPLHRPEKTRRKKWVWGLLQIGELFILFVPDIMKIKLGLKQVVAPCPCANSIFFFGFLSRP